MILAAGLAWFGVMFALGFLLGPVREFLLAPRLGPLGAILVEAVPMLAAMYLLAPRTARLFGVPCRAAPRLGMGSIGLLLLVLAETLLDQLLRGRVLWAERFGTPEGRVGLALLLAFALMPWLRRRA